MNRRSMVQRPLDTILMFIAILVLFSSASYALSPGFYKVPAILVTASPQGVGTGQVSNVNVKIVDISAWTNGGHIADDEVDLSYSGPGNAVFGTAMGKLDNNNQFVTTFKADKAGEYTINVRLTALVEATNGNASWVSANNSTKVTVTGSNLAIDPGVDLDPKFPIGSPSPSAGIRHDIDFNDSGIVGIGLPDNNTASPSPQPSNDTAGQATPSGSSSPGASPSAQDSTQPSSAASPGTSSPSPSAASQQGGNGGNGSMTTYLVIAVVVLIVVVGVLGGYILGKGKK